MGGGLYFEDYFTLPHVYRKPVSWTNVYRQDETTSTDETKLQDATTVPTNETEKRRATMVSSDETDNQEAITPPSDETKVQDETTVIPGVTEIPSNEVAAGVTVAEDFASDEAGRENNQFNLEEPAEVESEEKVESKEIQESQEPDKDVSVEEAENEEEEILKSSLGTDKAATIIQAAFRGHVVRQAEPLKHLKVISEVMKGLESLKKEYLWSEDSRTAVFKTPQDKLRMTETLMALLLRLDTVQSPSVEVRHARKTTSKTLIEILDTIEDMAVQLSSESPELADQNPGVDSEVKTTAAEEVAANDSVPLQPEVIQQATSEEVEQGKELLSERLESQTEAASEKVESKTEPNSAEGSPEDESVPKKALQESKEQEQGNHDPALHGGDIEELRKTIQQLKGVIGQLETENKSLMAAVRGLVAAHQRKEAESDMQSRIIENLKGQTAALKEKLSNLTGHGGLSRRDAAKAFSMLCPQFVY